MWFPPSFSTPSFCRMLYASTATTVTHWRAGLSAIRSLISPRSSLRCWSTITSPSRSRFTARAALTFCALACAALVLLGGCKRENAGGFQLTDVTGANFGQSLELTDHNGTRRTLRDFKG